MFKKQWIVDKKTSNVDLPSILAQLLCFSGVVHWS